MTTCAPFDQGASPVTSWPFTWKSGRPHKIVLPAPNRSSLKEVIAQASNASEKWVRRAIFGRPVVPPVQK